MKKIITTLLLLSTWLMASSIEINDAYARATPPALPNSAVFLTIKNHSDQDVSLIAASSSAAKTVELHTHDMKNGVMKMYQVPNIPIKAKSQTLLQPGGYHIMLIGLTDKPLKVGQEVELILNFSNGKKMTINAPVKTVMGGMKKKSGMSCGQGKCGSSMKKGMSCGQGKCGSK